MQYNFYQTSLSKCLSLIIDYRGRTPKKLGLDWSDDGYRAISANNVKFSGLTKIDDIKFGNQELYDLWMKKEVKKGDLLLTSEAPSGQVMIWDSDEKIILSQRLYALRVNDNFDNKYLKYYIQSEMGQKEIIKNNSGSTVFGISAKTFDNIIVYHPIKDIQEKIGNLLYTIDKKIVLNKQINARLEQMAKTLYDYWFVQFDFPDASGKPYKSSGGEMVFDETLKREIPKGWEVKSLGEIVNFKNGINYSSDDVGDSVSYIVNVRDVSNSSIFIHEDDLDIVNLQSDKLQAYQIKENTILVARSGNPGATRLLVNTNKLVVYCGFIIAVEPKESNLLNLLFWFLKNQEERISDISAGTVLKNVSQDVLKRGCIVIPDKFILNKFNEFNRNIFAEISSMIKQNHQLTQLRDFLLPMLMNGQVSVAE